MSSFSSLFEDNSVNKFKTIKRIRPKSVNMEHCKFTVSHLDMLEKAMAPHSSTLAWEISWAEEPGRLQSMGSQKSQTRLSNFPFSFPFHALEKEMVAHSSVLAWRIPETEEPGGLPSLGSHRVGHD